MSEIALVNNSKYLLITKDLYMSIGYLNQL